MTPLNSLLLARDTLWSRADPRCAATAAWLDESADNMVQDIKNWPAHRATSLDTFLEIVYRLQLATARAVLDEFATTSGSMKEGR